MSTEGEKKVRCIPMDISLSDDDPNKLEKLKGALTDFFKAYGLELSEEPPKDAVIDDRL